LSKSNEPSQIERISRVIKYEREEQQTASTPVEAGSVPLMTARRKNLSPPDNLISDKEGWAYTFPGGGS
jgi:hypothetical protein